MLFRRRRMGKKKMMMMNTNMKVVTTLKELAVKSMCWILIYISRIQEVEAEDVVVVEWVGVDHVWAFEPLMLLQKKFILAGMFFLKLLPRLMMNMTSHLLVNCMVQVYNSVPSSIFFSDIIC